MNLDRARPGQRLAIEKIIERAREGARETGIILPTRYGKRDVIIAAGVELYDQGLTCCNLVINPSDSLKRQFIRKDKFGPALERYGLLRLDRRIDHKTLDSAWPGIDFAPDGELFVSSTIQLVQTWKSTFVKWVESMNHRHGKPVWMWCDEVQFQSEKNTWGKTIDALLDASARMVGLTAIADRDDGERPLGFREKLVKTVPIKVTVPRVLPPDPDAGEDAQRRCEISIYQGQKNHFELDPDFQWKFKDAWAEGALCKISLRTLDVEMKLIDPGGDKAVLDKKLSELSVAETRKALPKVVRHPAFLRDICKIAIEVDRIYRQICPDVAGFVYSLNDEADDAQFNQHAEAIRATFKELGSDLKYVIATTANDKSGNGPSGAKILDAFTDEKNPVGDVCILKQMAGCGLDASRIFWVLDLSTTRTVGGVIQRWNRGATPYRGILTAAVIAPMDILTLAIHQKFVKEDGGEATSIDLDELTKRYTIPFDPKEEPIFAYQRAVPGDTHDTCLNVIGFADIPLVHQFIEEFPNLIRDHTIPEIALKARRIKGGMDREPVGEGESINTGDRMADLKKQITLISKTVVKYWFAKATGRGYTKAKEDQDLYGEIMKQQWGHVKNRVGGWVDYDKINDLPTVEKIYSAWEDLIRKGVA